MTESTTPPGSAADDESSARDLLAGAARASVTADLSLEDFMRAAWLAYTDARPGLREQLEERAMIAQLEALRERGQLASA